MSAPTSQPQSTRFVVDGARPLSWLSSSVAHDLAGAAGTLRLFIELRQRGASEAEKSLYDGLLKECLKVSAVCDLLGEVEDLESAMLQITRGSATPDEQRDAIAGLVRRFLCGIIENLETAPAEIALETDPAKLLTRTIALHGLAAAYEPAGNLAALRETWLAHKTPDRACLLRALLMLGSLLHARGLRLDARIPARGSLEILLHYPA